MAESPSSPSGLRWAFVGICVLLSVVLMGSVASNYFGARQLADVVSRGQAAMLFHLTQRLAPPGPPRPTQAELDVVLEEGESLGLRYVALVAVSGIELEAGTPSSTVEYADVRPNGNLERLGETVRVWAPGGPRMHPPALSDPKALGLPPRPGGPPMAGGRLGSPGPGRGPGLRGPPDGEGKRPFPPMRGRAPAMVVEFVPTNELALLQRATRDLFIGLASIAVLWGAAFLFWKLAHRAASVETVLAQKQHLASLGEMSAVIAHELRNPLASLKGHAQLLREQVDEPRAVRKAQRVVDEAVRLQGLTSGLLDFVRSGKVQTTATSPRELVNEAVAGSVATVRTDIQAAPEAWTMDKARMRQVLINLLDNAHHASPQTPVTLQVRGADDVLIFAVRDRGPGVPPERRDTIFTPFNTGRTQGTGLGLAVCKRIVTLHGGTISCDDHPDGGAVFTVTLPKET